MRDDFDREVLSGRKYNWLKTNGIDYADWDIGLMEQRS